ncbi:MAG: YbaB/EbfC family nucleoid-associated protein [Campylobacterota bacterium]
MFDNLGDMSKMFEQLQSKVSEMEAQQENVTLSAKSGGGMVEVKANGKGEVIDIDIDDSLLEDKESLQILLISAINDINKSVEENKKSQAMSMMGGANPFTQG